MRTLSLDLRERILATYDNEEATRDQVARRFRVSLGMVKKLIQQRRHTGDIRPRHHRSGRKPFLVDTHRRQMRTLLGKEPDMTLKELRQAMGLNCTLQAIHYVLDDMDLTYKKRHSGPVSKIGPTSRGRAGRGGGSKSASIRPN